MTGVGQREVPDMVQLRVESGKRGRPGDGSCEKEVCNVPKEGVE